MRLLEFASTDDLLKLWQIVSQNVFAAVEKERREAEEARPEAKSVKISTSSREWFTHRQPAPPGQGGHSKSWMRPNRQLSGHQPS